MCCDCYTIIIIGLKLVFLFWIGFEAILIMFLFLLMAENVGFGIGVVLCYEIFNLGSMRVFI